MTNWFIIQSLQSYSEHPDWIGCGFKEGTEDPIHGMFKRIQKGDKVAYYATGDKVVVGIFEVISKEMEIVHGDKYWSDPIGIYRLQQYALPPKGQYLDFKKLLFSKENSFELFPDKDRWTYVIWNHYIHRLSNRDLVTIERALSDSRYLTNIEGSNVADSDLREKTITDRLGSPFETPGLLFEPIDEMGVVYLFATHHKRLGFPYVVRLRDKFPDAIVIDSHGERKTIELEHKASNFIVHKHALNGCDYAICWENDAEIGKGKSGPRVIALKEALSDILTPRR